MPASERRPGPLRRAGLCMKRLATALYGPADLPDEVDPLTDVDAELGKDTHPEEPPHRSERQIAYDNLPREHE